MAYQEAFGDIAAAFGWPHPAPPLEGTRGALPSRLPVEDAAAATVAAALTAAGALQHQTTGHRPSATLHRAGVAAAFTSERWLRLRGESPGAGFAPLSRFWPTADGWLRTHANYDWHREALLAALDAPDDVEAVGRRLLSLRAADAEREIVTRGGVAAAVRTEGRWRAEHATRPLVHARFVGDAPARAARGTGLPADGVRVLDLTRVIAGPVGTRFLAALGADVLRIDPPQRPELVSQRPEGLLGKRSSVLDLAHDADRLHQLLAEADVVVHGYRPGALAAYGLDGEALAQRHPGLVVVELSAWGGGDHRRGFDSIVQAACGIAVLEAKEDGTPGALPCQALDHGTGYLVAAAAVDGLRTQRAEGGTQLRALSLAATADWLLSLPRTESVAAAGDLDPTAWLQEVDTVTAVRPPGTLDGTELSWRRGVPAYGGDAPSW